MKFASVKMMQLDFQGMVYKICFLFFFYKFLLRCYSLFILSIISDMLTSRWSFFSDVGRWIVIFTILLADLSEPRSLVPTWMIKWSGAFLKENCIEPSMQVVFALQNVLGKSCSLGYWPFLTFSIHIIVLLCYLPIWLLILSYQQTSC